MHKLLRFLFLILVGYLSGFSHYAYSFSKEVVLKKVQIQDSLKVIKKDTITSLNKEKIAKTPRDSIYNRCEKIYYKAEVDFDKGNFTETAKKCIEIIKISKENNFTDLLYLSESLLGNTYMELRDYETAAEYFNRVLNYAEKEKDSSVLVIAYMDLANLKSSQGKLEEGLAYNNKVIPIAEKINDQVNLAITYYNIVDSNLDLKNYRAARSNLRTLEKMLLNDKNKFLQASSLYLKGRYFYGMKRYKKAIENLKKAIELEDPNYVIGLTGYNEYLAKSYYGNKQYKKASDILVQLDSLKTKKFEVERAAEIQKVISQFDVDDMEQKLKESEYENKIALQKAERNETVFMWISIAAGLFIIYLLSLLELFRRRKKLVKDLRAKNQLYLEAKEKSERLAKSKTKFFSTISHELRTPLYGIIGLSSVLLEENKLEKHNQDLQSLKFSADYLLALINDVLLINKLDTRKDIQYENEVFQLRKLINNIVNSFEFMRKQNNNAIFINVDDSIPVNIKGPAMNISQILINLIGNACKFTENGKIFIAVNVKENNEKNIKLCFKIKDTGVGISPEKQKGIFEEFTTHSVENKYVGTGLGLSIVKRLLKLHNSKINLHSEVGKGSVFSFDLEFEHVTGRDIISQPVEKLPLDKLVGKKVLIVDDNRINQIVTKKTLEKHQVICETANNGQLAVDIVKKSNFDLILMDVNMPVLNGLDATESIRKFNTETPVLALTAVEKSELERDIFECGMNGIIIKPYELVDFYDIILKNLN